MIQASQHLKGTLNNPTKTSVQYKASMNFHFKMGVQGKHKSQKGIVELVSDKSECNKDYQN